MNPHRIFRSALQALFAAVLPALALASDPEEAVVMSAGTFHTSPESGETWAYVTWQQSLEGILDEGPVAVFRKEGFPEDPGQFERRSVAGWITDPLTIQSVVGLAPHVNDDPVLLEHHIDEIFGEVLEDAAGDIDIPLHEKISALLATAPGDAEVREDVIWVAKMHPVLNLCIGRAFAEPIPSGSPTTFEIRRWDASAGESREVIGRVTVDPTNPADRYLPAPGPPVVVEVESARAHLNARFLWAEPDALRKRAPLHYGFNLYRIEEEEAIANGWVDSPPEDSEILAAFAEDEAAPAIVRVNQIPILTDRDLTHEEVIEMSLPEENDLPPNTDPFHFFLDDNRRFHEGEPFEDGDAFYYFLTARDLLGRDGRVSVGVHVIMCSRIPPNAPSRVWVENAYEYDEGSGEADHHLAIHWESDADADAYYVFRFADIGEMQAATLEDFRTEAHLIAGPIDADGGEVLQYLDDGTGAPTGASAAFPSAPDDYGVPWLYTVRAAEDSACDDPDSLVQSNLSGHGTPAWGVLRRRDGPGAAQAQIVPTLRAIHLSLAHPGAKEEGFVNLDEEGAYSQNRNYRATVQRHHPGVEWAEFQLIPFAPDIPFEGLDLGRVDFGQEETVSVDFSIPDHYMEAFNPLENRFLFIVSKAGGSGLVPAQLIEEFGNIQGYAVATEGNIAEVVYHADIETGHALEETDPDVHFSHDPETGEIICLDLEVDLGAESRAAEWRIYRRLGQGDLELVHQEMREPDAGGALEWQDCSLPARGGPACYFVQTLDDEGNPGPLSPAGCVEIEGTQDLPTPMLFPVQPFGSEADGQARITWFSPPEGVERFEVLVAGDNGPPPEEISPDLSKRRSDTPERLSGHPDLDFFVYDTGRVGFNLEQDGTEFSVEAAFPGGEEDTILVRAAGDGPYEGRPAQQEENRPAVAERPRGEPSNAEAFQWTPPPDDVAVTVPWPALPRVGVADSESSRLQARLLRPEEFTGPMIGAGVRIGEFRFIHDGEPAPMPDTFPYPLPYGFNPADGVFTPNARDRVSDDPSTDRSLLPAVLYRYQVPSALFPEVSGDLVQVSPLIREIAYQSVDMGDRAPNFNALQDPFIAVRVKEEDEIISDLDFTHDLFLMDNQSIVLGATYRYLLVSVRDDGEIGRVYPVPPMETIPELETPSPGEPIEPETPSPGELIEPE